MKTIIPHSAISDETPSTLVVQKMKSVVRKKEVTRAGITTTPRLPKRASSAVIPTKIGCRSAYGRGSWLNARPVQGGL